MGIIGIDVGAKGSLCHLNDSGRLITILPFALDIYVCYLKSLESIPIVIVEEVHSMPRQGVKSMFSFGTRFGEIIGILSALGIPYTLLKPKQWQSSFKFEFDVKNEFSKEALAEVGISLYTAKFPDEVLPIYKKNGKIDTDKSDSLMIAMSQILGKYSRG